MTRVPRNRHKAEALDVASFCGEGGQMEGERALRQLPRLAEAVRCGDDGFAGATLVRWRAAGEVPPQRGGATRWVIGLHVDTDVVLECQRCLQPLAVPLRVERQVVFVRGEDEAARLDEELEDDVLALPARLDLFGLIEDELLLALPLVPRHEACPHLPAVLQAAGAGPARPADAPPPSGHSDPTRHRPFAGLADLARRGGAKGRGGDGSSGGGSA